MSKKVRIYLYQGKRILARSVDEVFRIVGVTDTPKNRLRVIKVKGSQNHVA